MYSQHQPFAQNVLSKSALAHYVMEPITAFAMFSSATIRKALSELLSLY